jgi:uncharacterized integral membrane protein
MKDFFFTLLAWLITLPFIAASACFAFFNQEEVAISINPLYPPIPLPLYVPVLGAIAFGFLFGAIMTWAAGGDQRRKLHKQKKRINHLEKQLVNGVTANPRPFHNYGLIPTRLLQKRWP